MKHEPLVTIITTTFNIIESGRETYFRQNVKSIKDQTYRNIEHLIVDGASSDGTVEILQRYKDKGIVDFVSEPDRGIYDAMNKGIKAARGKYIAFLNSDDYYHSPEAVSRSVRALEAEGADFSYANFFVIGKGVKYIEKGDINKFLYTMPFGHPTMFAKKEVLLSEGGFDEKFKLPADYDLIIRLILNGYKSVFVDSEIATYRLGGLGSTTDHSGEISEIYMKNYRQFYPKLTKSQAHKIMYEGIVPKGLPESFKNFAKRKGLTNFDSRKVVANLRTMVRKEQKIRKILVFVKRFILDILSKKGKLNARDK